MDLYYAMTNYQLLGCMLHKLLYNRENNARILLSSFLVYHSPNLVEDLKKSEIFVDVMVYDEVIFSHDKNIKILDEIKRICEDVERGYGRLIEGCRNIYVGQDCDSLGVYLVSTGRKYYYFEDASGSYSKLGVLMDIVKNENRNRYNIITRLKLGGRSEYVLKVYCDFENQGEGFDSTNCVDFAVRKQLDRLDNDDLAKVLGVFNCRSYDVAGKKADLLLTWHYNNMGFMTLDEQKEFFATLVDYFKDDTEVLFIKPHPSDKQPDYKEWFEDAVIFERYVPSELLPFCVNGVFEKGITNWSTSVFNLREMLKDVVNFDKDIDKTWRNFHKYYAIVQYLNRTKGFCWRKSIKLIRVNKKQLTQLMRKYIGKRQRSYKFSEKGRIYIVDRYDEGYRGKKCIALAGKKGSRPSAVLRIGYKGKMEMVYLYNLSSGNIHVEKEMHYLGDRVIIDSYDADESRKGMEGISI